MYGGQQQIPFTVVVFSPVKGTEFLHRNIKLPDLPHNEPFKTDYSDSWQNSNQVLVVLQLVLRTEERPVL